MTRVSNNKKLTKPPLFSPVVDRSIYLLFSFPRMLIITRHMRFDLFLSVEKVTAFFLAVFRLLDKLTTIVAHDTELL